MVLTPYKTPLQRAWHYSFRGLCRLIFIFLIAPLLIVAPLSFNVEPYFSFTPGMLALEHDAYSTRWYENIVNLGMANPDASYADGWLADMWENAQ